MSHTKDYMMWASEYLGHNGEISDEILIEIESRKHEILMAYLKQRDNK